MTKLIPKPHKKPTLRGAKLGIQLWLMFLLIEFARYSLNDHEVDIILILILLPTFITIFACGGAIMSHRSRDQ